MHWDGIIFWITAMLLLFGVQMKFDNQKKLFLSLSWAIPLVNLHCFLFLQLLQPIGTKRLLSEEGKEAWLLNWAECAHTMELKIISWSCCQFIEHVSFKLEKLCWLANHCIWKVGIYFWHRCYVLYNLHYIT